MNSDSTPPDPVFFLDYSLGGIAVRAALQTAGVRVEVLLDHFPSDISDIDLLAELGKRQWVFLSKDGNIRRRALERAALMAGGVQAFILTSGNLRAEEQAEAFRLAAPMMCLMCATHPGPFIAAVTRAGNVAMISDKQD